MAMSGCRARTFQSFTSFISTPDFVNDEAHEPHPDPDLLVNLGVVGLHGDPNIFNEALKHLALGPAAQAVPTRSMSWEGHRVRTRRAGPAGKAVPGKRKERLRPKGSELPRPRLRATAPPAAAPMPQARRPAR